MNKVFQFFCLVAVLFFTLACYSSSAVLDYQSPTVTATRQDAIKPTATRLVAVVTAVQSLYVRDGAGTQFRVIGYLLTDSVVNVMGKCTKNGWVKISAGNVVGYVNADYLSGSICGISRGEK